MSEKQSTPRYWFPAKPNGWGWGPPCAWEGWLVLLAFVMLLFTAGRFFVQYQNLPGFLVNVLVLGGVLIAVCLWKGEPPRWRSGGK